MVNWHRYEYLLDRQGGFLNVFDAGVVHNVKDFLTDARIDWDAQREDKSFAAGVVRVTTHHVVFEAADGAPGSFAIHASHIAGAPQRNKPGSGRSLLRLPTSAGPRLLEFRDEAERDACTDAVLRAQRGESSHVSDPTRWKRLQEDPELQALHRDLAMGTATEVNKAVAQAVNEYAKQKERELSDYAKTDEMWQGVQELRC
eukprot:jgi/Pico_ML_1/52546/g3235.t1